MTAVAWPRAGVRARPVPLDVLRNLRVPLDELWGPIAHELAERVADAAAFVGYADQAHLARDTRRIAGVPLTDLL